MGKLEREEKRLNLALSSHLSNIHDTLQALDQSRSSSQEKETLYNVVDKGVKVTWDDVIKMGEQVSKQATMAGMLWTGNKPEVNVLEENMQAYFNMLQGLVLYAYSSSVGAGPTLLASINASIKQVVDCSFGLWKDSVSSYASSDKEKRLTIPQIVGTIWDACSALKKTPSSNITAIGRAMTQVAVSMKDVLREMQELKPSTADEPEESSDSTTNQPLMEDDNMDESSEISDLGSDLSPEEMKIAQAATRVIYETLTAVKELIRSITGLLKREELPDISDGFESLEKLLKLCQDAGLQIDELGASIYPPQELASIASISEVISGVIDKIQEGLGTISGSTQGFSQACGNVKRALSELKSEVGSQESVDVVELVPQMQNLVVDS